MIIRSLGDLDMVAWGIRSGIVTTTAIIPVVNSI
jgi:hypothetical protein